MTMYKITVTHPDMAEPIEEYNIHASALPFVRATLRQQSWEHGNPVVNHSVQANRKYVDSLKRNVDDEAAAKPWINEWHPDTNNGGFGE